MKLLNSACVKSVYTGFKTQVQCHGLIVKFQKVPKKVFQEYEKMYVEVGSKLG